ncbi:class I SAM-dependent DNA methyltransferase [Anaeromonas gelatinilytica]|uniref:class I SAM-dependent DNA methyltransferase n=1 Tax=Anaeromonas gelatinilytica TaxID=2683194 RepID=UPI00207855FF|nr:class I SAM-dependent methyltransferase [Anaeromonas gelatinilytica]
MAYEEFAEVYDRLMTEDIDYEKWYKFIKNIYNEYNVRPYNILEMACGTGNLTKYFAKDYYNISCFDISEDMLSIAYKKLRNYKNVCIRHMNMLDFKFNKKFQSIISICDSINYILDIEDLKKVFKNVYNHLEDKGIFVFDINSYYKLSNIIGNNTFIYDEKDVFYTWENEFQDNIANFYLTFFVYRKGMYERFDEFHQERAYRSDEIIDLLKEIGYKNISVYDGLTFNLSSTKSTRINFVASK